MQTSSTARLLRIRDVAERLDVCMKTVERLIARKTIPSIRIGGSVRVDPRDLKNFIERGREKAAA